MQTGSEKTLAIFYTDYAIGSCVAYSNDAGRTWTRHPRNPCLAGTKEIRDPKVFWCEPAKEWRMIRYEDKDFVFYGSPDLFNWRELSRTGGFYECPDLFELPIEGSASDRKWVLCGADGGYLLGAYDGTSFKPETGMLHTELTGRGSFYAPQTWTRPTDQGASVVQMGFLFHPKGSHLTWHNQMCFPVTLTLRPTAEGVRLFREPIPDIAALREESQSWQNLTLKPGDNPLADIHGDAIEIRAEVEFGTATAFTLTARGKAIRFAADGPVNMAGVKEEFVPSGRRVVLQLLVDRSLRGALSRSRTRFHFKVLLL